MVGTCIMGSEEREGGREREREAERERGRQRERERGGSVLPFLQEWFSPEACSIVICRVCMCVFMFVCVCIGSL